MVSVDEVFGKVVAFSTHASRAGVEFLNVDHANKKILFKRGSVVGQVGVVDKGDGIIMVVIHIPIVWKPKRLDGNTLLDLLQRNSDILYGALGYDKENNMIDYSYALLGNTLDAEEMFAALAIMSTYADNIDEELCQLTGGERGIDYLSRQA